MTDPVDGRRSRLARSGLIASAGSVINGLAAFGVVMAVTRGLDNNSASGAVFTAMAVFNITYIVSTLGADVAIVRAVARDDTPERAIVRTAIVPTLLVSVTAAAALILFRGALAGALGDESTRETLERSLLAVAPFVPAASLTTVLIATTRGRGTMTPTAVVERISRPSSQLMLVVVAGVIGLGAGWTALAWAAAFGLGLVPAIGMFARNVPPDDGRSSDQVQSEYWRFAAPQAVTTMLQVLLRWADIVLVAALADPATAAVYTAASRLVLAGNFLNLAIVQAVSPMVSSALARGDRDGAQDLLRVGTSWLVAAVWPGYLLLIAFGSTIVGIFGPGYQSGGTTVLILGGAMLVASAVGPIEAVLLMAGGSRSSLADNAVALGLNIVLNFALVPTMGIEGAAIAWGAALLVTNLAPLVQVHHRLGINPFGIGHMPALISSVGVIGVPALTVRLTLDPGMAGVAATGVCLIAVYVLVVGRFGDRLDLDELTSALKRPRRTGT